jgi:hypothetical protein
MRTLPSAGTASHRLGSGRLPPDSPADGPNSPAHGWLCRLLRPEVSGRQMPQDSVRPAWRLHFVIWRLCRGCSTRMRTFRLSGHPRAERSPGMARPRRRPVYPWSVGRLDLFLLLDGVLYILRRVDVVPGLPLNVHGPLLVQPRRAHVRRLPGIAAHGGPLSSRQDYPVEPPSMPDPASSSARCSARRPVDCWIWVRQLNPSARTTADGSAARTAGSTTRSPTACATE